MAASLSGGWLGFTELPERWASLMADYTYINRVAENVTLIALRKATENTLRLTRKPKTVMADILGSLRQERVIEGSRYWHPLFGEGRVHKVDTQEVGRPKVKGRVMMATVDFDVGQTCKFSSDRLDKFRNRNSGFGRKLF